MSVTKKKTIIISVEVGDREYDAAVFLATKFLRENYRVIIGTNRALKILEGRLENCIFLHKSTIEKYAERYQTTLGAKVCFLDVESGVTIPDGRYKNWCHERFETVSAEKYDTVFTIGDVYVHHMKKMRQFEGVSVVASGWPRLDLLHKSNRAFYDKQVNQIREKYGKFILVISSFGFVTGDEFEAWSSVNKNFFGEDFVSPAWEYMNKFVDLTKTLAKQNKQRVILRPHPAEFIKSWTKKLDQVPNLSIVYEGDIIPWLIAAERIVQFRSSTALEASLLGRENLALRIDSEKYETDSPVYKLNKEFDNSEQLVRHVEDGIENVEEVIVNTKKALDGYVSNIDGTASEIIVKKINKIQIEAANTAKVTLLNKIQHKIFMQLADMVESVFFNTILSPAKWRYLFTYKQKLGTPITVESCKDRLDRLGICQSSYDLISISRDLVQLEQEKKG